MDWGAGSIIEEGSAEAHETELDIVRAAVDLPGGGVQRQGEPGVEYLWRCGALRTAALAATPLLQRAVDAGAAHCKGKRYAAHGAAMAALLAAELGAAGGGSGGGHAGASGSGSGKQGEEKPCTGVAAANAAGTGSSTSQRCSLSQTQRFNPEHEEVLPRAKPAARNKQRAGALWVRVAWVYNYVYDY